MEDLDLDRQFGAIYLAGPTFNLLPDDLIASSALHAIARHLLPEGAALVPLCTPPPTPPEQFGVERAADLGDVEVRYVIESEDYDTEKHTRTSNVRYELGRGADAIVEHRDWIIHRHEDDRIRQLAAAAGLSISLTVIDAEQLEATLQRLP